MIKILALILIVLNVSSDTYTKNYYSNGKLKSEGWLNQQGKMKYWYFYHSNGKIKSEGHYQNNKKVKYWHHFDPNGKKIKEGRYQHNLKQGWWKLYKYDTIIEVKYKNSMKVGLAIYKVENKPVKAEYYKNDVKTNEWFNLRDFKKEYPSIND